MGLIPAGKTVSIARQLCEGLAEAHSLGIVHRDLKPQNVMVDEGGNAKIMDFGIARSLSGKKITGAGVMIGTPEYMSPEQVEGKEVGQRSDIYSLGIILYEMATGRVPFEGDTAFTIGVKQKSETPKDPRSLNAQVPEDLSRLILRCLEKDREKRPRTTADVITDLDKIEKGLPTTERVAPERKTLTSREITVKLTPKKLLVPALAVVAIITAALFLPRLFPKKKVTVAASGKPSLAVMYFENLSDQKDLDKIVVSLLTTNLSRYEEVEVLSQQRLFDLSKKLGKEDAVTIDRKVATEVAEQAGVKTMVLGSIVKLGEKIRVSPQLIDVKTGAVTAVEPVDGTKIDDVFAMVDDLTAKIGARLEFLSAAEKGKKLEIKDVTTSSVEAYQAYQKGLGQFSRWDFSGAQEFFQKSIELDPTFATAYLMLAMVQSQMTTAFFNPYSDPSTIKRTFGLAKKYSAKATDLERRMIDFFIAFSNFDTPTEGSIVADLADKYPNEKNAFLMLHMYYWQKNDFLMAKEAVEKLLELDPTFANGYNQLAYCNALLKDRAGALSAARKYVNIDPDVGNAYASAWDSCLILGLADEALGFLEEYRKRYPETVSLRPGYTWLLKGDPDRARQEFLLFAEKNLKSLAANALVMGITYFVEGRYEKAQAEFVRGVEAARREKNLSSERLARINSGYLKAALRKYDEALAEYALAERLSLQLEKEDFRPYTILTDYLTGVALIGKGDYQAAQDEAGTLRSILQKGNYTRLHSNCEHLLLAELSIARKDAERARDELGAVLEIAPWTSPQYQRLAVSLEMLQGRPEKAIEMLGDYFGNWLSVVTFGWPTHAFGYFEQRSRLGYNVGKLYEQAGNPAKAREHYEKFLALMRNADPGVPEVADAQKRLAALK